MERQHPRISVLKLAEYMGANAVRRRSIIRHQQDPPTEIVPHYRRAMAAAARFLRRGGTDVGLLQRAIHNIESTEWRTDWQKRDLGNSAQALEHLQRVIEEVDLGERVLGARHGARTLWLAQVEVSIRPHVVFAKQGDELRVGALKLAFAKTREIPEEEGAWAATLLRRTLEERLEHRAVLVDPALCQVVDLFRERVFVAPKTYKRTMQLAEAACEEIYERWPGQRPGPSQRPRTPPPGPTPQH